MTDQLTQTRPAAHGPDGDRSRHRAQPLLAGGITGTALFFVVAGAQHEPDASALDIKRAPGHVDKVLRLGPGDVSVAALRAAYGDPGEDCSDISGRDRLQKQRRQLRGPVAFDPTGDRRRKVEELRCRDDGVRDWPGLNRGLLGTLAGVMRIARHVLCALVEPRPTSPVS